MFFNCYIYQVVKRKILKILKWIAIALIGFVFTVVLLFFIFRKDIEKYAIKTVNEEITVPFTVKSFDVVWWKTFPNLSFQINDLAIEESTPIFRKPLCTAHEVLLVFNIWDLVNGKIIIKKIKVNGLNAKLGIKDSKTNNFDILKKAEKDEPKNAAIISLKKISVKNSEIQFRHLPTAQNFVIGINSSSTDLDIAEKNIDLNVSLDGTCNKYIRKTDTLISEKSIELDCKMSINDNLLFKNISLKIEKSLIEASGSINDFNNKQQTNIAFNTKNLTLDQIFPWIPSNSFDQNAFKSKGVIDAKGKIHGNLDNLSGEIFCLLRKGSVENKQYDVVVKDIDLETTISFGNNEAIILKRLSGNLEESPIELAGSLKDFSNPFVDFAIKGSLNLDKVAKFMNMEQKMSGTAKLDVNYEGYTKTLSEINTANQWKGKGSIELNNAGLTNNRKEDIFNNVYGSFKIGANNLTVENLRGNLTGKAFSFDGQVQRIASYLFTEDKNLTIIGNLHSKYIDYENLEYIFENKEKSNNSKNPSYSLPKNITAQLKISIDSFKQGKFMAGQVGGTALLNEGSLQLKGMQMHFHEGNLKGNLNVKQDATSGNFIPVGYFECYNVSIQKLFYAFDNFSQTEITTNNIEGLIDAKMSIAGIWNNKLECQTNELFANIDFTIREGRLKNYDPMLAMAKFVNIDDLKDIKFEKLSQSIEIKDGKIFMSNLDIKNNAVSLLVLSGIHTFDNVMDYHLKISVNDILAQKYSLRKRRNLDEYEETSNGGMNLFIHMFGNADNLKFAYDRKETVKEIVRQVKEEKKELKEILRQEFGLKSKDTTALKPKHVKVEWDE